ncbi:MAG TPA: histidine phosphatase family protein [Pilimelia sp.]|nr:histidine phosphatase family protein [Pilimelia sp.]
MAVQIVYETHSVTTDNEAGVATGWLPGELSPQGRALAEQLGYRRRGGAVVAVFTSDLHRALQTARIAFDGSGLPIYTDARLRECNYGTLNGAPVTLFSDRRRERIERPFPRGESYRQVVDRTRSFLRDLSGRFDGTTVVVIAHTANRWALDHLLCGRAMADLVDAPFDWQEGWFYELPTGWTG